MNCSGKIERVISSPDQDAIGGNATYCVGCGTCAYLDPAFRIIRNSDGCNQAEQIGDPENRVAVEAACPFASDENEDTLGKMLFSEQPGIQHDENLGWFLSTYVGYVKTGDFRARGSSGGFVSWLAATMLQRGMIDAVIHVKDGGSPEQMYTYQISHTLEELEDGAKSKYYPVEISGVLRYVREHEGRYLFIGLPCFVKAVRLLCRQDSVINERIA